MFGRSIPALGEWAKGLMDGNGPAFLAGTKAPAHGVPYRGPVPVWDFGAVGPLGNNLSEASANQSPPDDASQHDVEPYSGLAGAQGGTSERGLFESSSWAASSAVRFGGYFSPLDFLCEAYHRLLSRMAWRVWLCSALLPLAEQSVGKVRCGDGILCPILPLGNHKPNHDAEQAGKPRAILEQPQLAAMTTPALAIWRILQVLVLAKPAPSPSGETKLGRLQHGKSVLATFVMG
ncbi:hypothetical protein CPAR01_08638 [Colletotrichum paranaense]|uniref:Uncharacterized protein n=1 Tax=Colletotrichum paranaense TaxID=1914294 RepID=A0ABQ9SKU0_9PEZI|nr:uncharacterized protein CPAR01_08638 [Colletotrichum paranaense]KAK1538525.1 hypothetical protein CPAR01_08638 [Colletotrichum paranaense]